MHVFITLLILLGTISKLGTASSSATSLNIKTSIGIFKGEANSTTGLEIWRGVPYALPPVKSLRFKALQPIVKPFSNVVDATKFGAACPQPASGSIVGVPISEDCLVLNIFRPANTKPNAKLPVLVWIYGGSYNTGASSDPSFDPTLLINRSVHNGNPVIFVSLNYRVNAFGFLASSVMNPKDLNAGLQDQRAALNFVNKEIAAFGGDPNKVTIWGQSAGGGSVEAQVIYTTSNPPFRAAICDSSGGPFHSAPFPSEYDKPGMPYTRLVEAVGCPPGLASLSCLQNLPFEILLNASNSFIKGTLNNQFWYPTISGPGTFVTERASARISSKNFPHIPMIMGSNLNDGTIFSTSVLGLPKMDASAEQASFDAFIAANIPADITLSLDVLNRLYQLFPANDSSLGGRFNTGDSLFDRSAAWFTDQMYLSPRRLFFDNAANLQPLFGYLFDEFYPGSDPQLGVTHGSELRLIFGGAPDSEQSLSNAFTDAYLNFVNHLDPGAFWQRYNLQDRKVLHWRKDNISMIPDDFVIETTDFLNLPNVLAEFEK